MSSTQKYSALDVVKAGFFTWWRRHPVISTVSTIIGPLVLINVIAQMSGGSREQKEKLDKYAKQVAAVKVYEENKERFEQIREPRFYTKYEYVAKVDPFSTWRVQELAVPKYETLQSYLKPEKKEQQQPAEEKKQK